MSIKNLPWNSSCCGDGVQWLEMEVPSGDWLRIRKQFVGGYVVTRFGSDKKLKAEAIEVDEAGVMIELAK